jgi:ABC-type oligopeptide transport system ATPase subunit
MDYADSVWDTAITSLRQRVIRERNLLVDYTVLLMQRMTLTKCEIDRYPHRFSAGQHQHIGIVRALAM